MADPELPVIPEKFSDWFWRSCWGWEESSCCWAAAAAAAAWRAEEDPAVGEVVLRDEDWWGRGGRESSWVWVGGEVGQSSSFDKPPFLCSFFERASIMFLFVRDS